MQPRVADGDTRALDLEAPLAAVTPATRLLTLNAPNRSTGWTLPQRPIGQHTGAPSPYSYRDPGRRGYQWLLCAAHRGNRAASCFPCHNLPPVAWRGVAVFLEFKRLLAQITFCRISRAPLVQVNGVGWML